MLAPCLPWVRNFNYKINWRLLISNKHVAPLPYDVWCIPRPTYIHRRRVHPNLKPHIIKIDFLVLLLSRPLLQFTPTPINIYIAEFFFSELWETSIDISYYDYNFINFFKKKLCIDVVKYTTLVMWDIRWFDIRANKEYSINSSSSTFRTRFDLILTLRRSSKCSFVFYKATSQAITSLSHLVSLLISNPS